MEKSMINNHMDSEFTANVAPQPPNESTGIYVRGFVRISDPESGEVLVESGN